MTKTHYRGRFAPSPTGPLHFGSLVTALASYLEARTHMGQWLIRIEDLDPLREPPEATGQILHSLEVHGLRSDEPIRFQSRRQAAYHAVIKQLINQGSAYHCTCSRRQLLANCGQHLNDCQNNLTSPDARPSAIRFALQSEDCQWQDQLLGAQQQTIHAGVDDPVIRRKEGFYAYQLAVVVDDSDQRISHVVRGSDLLNMTAQQLQIYKALGAEPPKWQHIPVICNKQGQKLSKQAHASALNDNTPVDNLVRALKALNQELPVIFHDTSVNHVLEWAIGHWQREAIDLTSQ
ncbi:MAG TPA: tRNA glutamyl-Q(34) synthetase GluQRS [Marinobacter sp.]|nr:tRNA glutamyl-Q(34) synthetase GluQRS [Marinobacter sp.]